MRPSIKSLRLCLVLLLSAISGAPALEVNDPEHGFRFSLPDDFVRSPTPGGDILHSFRRDSKGPGQAATVVEVTPIEGTIQVGERINPSKIPTEKGVNISFDQIEWQTHTMDVIVGTPTDPEKSHVAVFTTLFPLSGQAVRFRVAGPASGEDSARALFDKTVASFANTKPLEMPVDRSERKSPASRIVKFVALILALVVIIQRAAKRANDKKLEKKLRRQQGQQPPRPPGIRRPQ